MFLAVLCLAGCGRCSGSGTGGAGPGPGAAYDPAFLLRWAEADHPKVMSLTLAEPRFVGPAEALAFLKDQDMVMGLALQGEARAYAAKVLYHHEVINDVVGGEPVLLSWCMHCGTGLVHRRRVQGSTTLFRASGYLYQGNSVMTDDLTGTLWSQILARGIEGPAAGQELEPVPFTWCTWQAWRARHPDTRVLGDEQGVFDRELMAVPMDPMYWESEKLPYPVRAVDPRMHPKTRVYGLRLGERARAYPVEVLAARAREAAEFPDRMGGTALVLSYDPGSREFRVRTGDGRELQAVPAYWFAWYSHFPGTSVYGAD